MPPATTQGEGGNLRSGSHSERHRTRKKKHAAAGRKEHITAGRKEIHDAGKKEIHASVIEETALQSSRCKKANITTRAFMGIATCQSLLPLLSDKMRKKVECGSSAQHVRRPFTRLQQRAIAQGLGHIDIISHPSKSKVKPTKSPRQGRIFPLSGGPYFTHIFSCSDILKSRLVITNGFFNHLPDAHVTTIFFCEGKTWEVTFHGGQDYKYFGCGLKIFFIDNDIRKGDGGVFELIDNKNLHFRVQILRVDIHFHAKDGDDGGSTDNPILID
ncbi:B3 domain-containing protein Os04g0386900-like [Curcuma longa]|uniref:B3 domain-containing protein Os04g0386900-like n=1 Tax=Curcuma longa TaxID=136217 RepID=UPI003D9F1D92